MTATMTVEVVWSFEELHSFLVARYGPADYSTHPPTGATTPRCAAACGVSERTWLRWHRTGRLTDTAADRAAIALGLWPGDIWDRWTDVAWVAA